MTQDAFPTPTPKPGELSFWTKLAFGAGDLSPALTANLQVFLLLPFLTDVAGLPAAWAGSVLMVGKVSDAVNDPIIGILSDRTRSRWGRRYPWILFGAFPFAIFFFLQWLVPQFGSATALFWYYLIVGILFNLAYTAVNLPYTALTPELTRDYNERTNLNRFRFTFSIGGSILSLLVAAGISRLIEDPQQRYFTIGAAFGLFSIIPLYWCVWGTKARADQMQATHQPAEQPTSIPLKKQLQIAFTNRPFLFVIGIYLFSWLAVQITATTLKYYVNSWMGLSDTSFYTVAVTVQGTAMVMLSVWSPLSRKLGKKTVYYMGIAMWVIAQGGLFFLQPGQVFLMYMLAVMAGLGVSTAYLIPWSMLPDVIELDELNTGQRREGVFYAFMVVLQKMGLALGLFLVGQALDLAGYVEGTAVDAASVQQPDSALLVIRLAIGPVPTLCLIAGMVLAYFYPITKEKHEEILLRLQNQDQTTSQSQP
ncbi:MFS transporter [Geitlerinema sp. PCC 9228]|uniref:MFS transporter n=1 Tax=Geitlerinema sp. PCC 9228 TaxID=111611 RepID=UPI0008F9DEEB|nr:MFS transporter [Geitlerinema sp. PCC 9228]